MISSRTATDPARVRRAWTIFLEPQRKWQIAVPSRDRLVDGARTCVEPALKLASSGEQLIVLGRRISAGSLSDLERRGEHSEKPMWQKPIRLPGRRDRDDECCQAWRKLNLSTALVDRCGSLVKENGCHCGLKIWRDWRSLRSCYSSVGSLRSRRCTSAPIGADLRDLPPSRYRRARGSSRWHAARRHRRKPTRAIAELGFEHDIIQSWPQIGRLPVVPRSGSCGWFETHSQLEDGGTPIPFAPSRTPSPSEIVLKISTGIMPENPPQRSLPRFDHRRDAGLRSYQHALSPRRPSAALRVIRSPLRVRLVGVVRVGLDRG